MNEENNEDRNREGKCKFSSQGLLHNTALVHSPVICRCAPLLAPISHRKYNAYMYAPWWRQQRALVCSHSLRHLRSGGQKINKRFVWKQTSTAFPQKEKKKKHSMRIVWCKISRGQRLLPGSDEVTWASCPSRLVLFTKSNAINKPNIQVFPLIPQPWPPPQTAYLRPMEFHEVCQKSGHANNSFKIKCVQPLFLFVLFCFLKDKRHGQ